MRLLTLLGAAVVAAAPAPALPSTAPAYAKFIATATCLYERTGLTSREAIRRAVDDFYPIYGDDISRDGSTVAARYMAAERARICGDWR
jgi:hypothetical protein